MIPILSPNFIESEWCCKEVEKFLAREKAINAEYPALEGKRRIFPIRYLPTDGAIAHKPAVLTELQRLQFADFTALRYEDPKSSDFRRAVGALAGAVCALLKTPVGEAKRTSASRPVSGGKKADPSSKPRRQRTAQKRAARMEAGTATPRKTQVHSVLLPKNANSVFDGLFDKLPKGAKQQPEIVSLSRLTKALGLGMQSALAHLKLDYWQNTSVGDVSELSFFGYNDRIRLKSGKVQSIVLTCPEKGVALINVPEIPYTLQPDEVRELLKGHSGPAPGTVFSKGFLTMTPIDFFTVEDLGARLKVRYKDDLKGIAEIEIAAL